MRMRAALWPESSAQSHGEEISAFLGRSLAGWLAGRHAVSAFVAVLAAGQAADGEAGRRAAVDSLGAGQGRSPVTPRPQFADGNDFGGADPREAIATHGVPP